VIAVLTAVVALSEEDLRAPARKGTTQEERPKVTPVEGPSWRKHLGLSYAQSAMGRMGFTPVGSSSAPSTAWGQSSTPGSLERPFILSGEDLYRLNCASCHNARGSGSPPEIRSLVDPVRATSPDLVRQQMTKRGIVMDEATIRQMAAQAEASLRERLAKGGEKMPAFKHLRGPEVEATLAYLRALAGVPGSARRQLHVTEPMPRVGELLAKGTCRICHDATGPGRDALASTPGLIPSLASLPEQNPVMSVIRKVREGAPAPGLPGSRGEMPVFSYLTADEVTATYFYLLIYPPRESSVGR